MHGLQTSTSKDIDPVLNITGILIFLGKLEGEIFTYILDFVKIKKEIAEGKNRVSIDETIRRNQNE